MYSNGASEIILGKAIKQLNLPREEIVVMTKVRYDTSSSPRPCALKIQETHSYTSLLAVNLGNSFGVLKMPNSIGYVTQYGQSRKHIFDSVQQSLKRLQLDYIDVLQCSLRFSFIRLLCMVGNRRSLALLMPISPAGHRFDYNTPVEEVVRA